MSNCQRPADQEDDSSEKGSGYKDEESKTITEQFNYSDNTDYDDVQIKNLEPVNVEGKKMKKVKRQHSPIFFFK